MAKAMDRLSVRNALHQLQMLKLLANISLNIETTHRQSAQSKCDQICVSSLKSLNIELSRCGITVVWRAMSKHMLIHKDLKPYSCKYKGCGKTFRSSDNRAK